MVLTWLNAVALAGLVLTSCSEPNWKPWQPIQPRGAPSPREATGAVWTGKELVVWSGTLDQSGGRYDPVTDRWTGMNVTAAPLARGGFRMHWTGKEVLVWGGTTMGKDGLLLVPATGGGRYDPAADSWAPISETNAPTPRHLEATVWTGTELLVWGGSDGTTVLNTGARYNPATDSWLPLNTTGAPSGRNGHAAVWTGSELLVWGGHVATAPGVTASGFRLENTGGRYDPAVDAWRTMSTTGAPRARTLGETCAIWAGKYFFVWGGAGESGVIGAGGRYDPVSDAWLPVTNAGAPSPRSDHAMVWTGEKVLVWGGLGGVPGWLADGKSYDIALDEWRPVHDVRAPSPRSRMAAVWNGDALMIWGGRAGWAQGAGTWTIWGDGASYEP